MTSILWLRSLAEKGGKGTVDNIDARALGRVAVEIEQLQFELREERKATARMKDYAFEEAAKLCDAEQAEYQKHVDEYNSNVLTRQTQASACAYGKMYASMNVAALIRKLKS